MRLLWNGELPFPITVKQSSEQSCSELLPMLERRDQLSIVHTDISAKLSAVLDTLTTVEAEHVSAARKNTELAATMLALAEDASTQKKEDFDAKTRRHLEELEEDLKVSKQRWRMMKGTASAMVAGSGLDWSRDEDLRELVLDEEDEE